MKSNEVWAICGDCGAELKEGDEQCLKCGSTKKTFRKEALVEVGTDVSAKTVQKRKGFKRPLRESISNRWKRSGDPKLTNGVREDVVIDRERDEYHQVVKDAKSGSVTHEEHQRLSQHNKQGKNTKGFIQKLSRWPIGAIISGVIAGIILLLVTPIVSDFVQRPSKPSSIFTPSSNPVVNTSDSQTITVTFTPDFKPPYSNNVIGIIQNNDSCKCYMVMEFRTSDGFKFLPLTDALPDNFRVEEGYQYQDVMKLYIEEFPPKFTYNLQLPVYTLDPESYRGTEAISMTALEVRREH